MKNPLCNRLVGVLMATYCGDIMRTSQEGIATRIEHSQSRQELQRRGQPVLRPIARKISALFPNGPAADPELFAAWVTLIKGISADHGLPPPPYNGTTKLEDQKLEAWIDYCQKNG